MQTSPTEEKNLLEYAAEQTSFRSTESTREGCIAKIPEQRLCVAAAQKVGDEKPPSRRRQMKSPDTGFDASPAGRIEILS